MNNILEKLFKKRGIKSVTELSHEEKETYENYQRILAKKEMTLADVREFIAVRVASIEMRWQDQSVEAAKKAELIPYHTVYKILLNAIDAPVAEREALERILIEQTK